VGQPCEVPSPTFTLVQTYDSSQGIIHHYDLYRLKHWEEALELGIEESFTETITLIEWPGIIYPVLPTKYLRLHLHLVSDSQRLLECEIKGLLDVPLQAFIQQGLP
jgi:tRNA threonylcarbamoyladenosine biosynthesis protein TsaE